MERQVGRIEGRAQNSTEHRLRFPEIPALAETDGREWVLMKNFYTSCYLFIYDLGYSGMVGWLYNGVR